MVRVRRPNQQGMGVLLLASTMINIGLERIPPVTLFLVAGQTAIFLGFFPKYFPSTMGVCMSSYLVVSHRDYPRMILSQLAHGDDMHLYFNMVSLIYKGIKLERAFGSLYFAYLVAVFTGATSLTYVGLSEMLTNLFMDDSYRTSCAVGFSGVIFALKVLATEYSAPGTQYIFGVVPVPSKYLFWAELVAIQLVSPGASFVGHLAGILVGVAYTRGPLKMLMNAFFTPGDYTPGSTPEPYNPRDGSSPTSAFTSFTSLLDRDRNRRPGGNRRPTQPHSSGAFPDQWSRQNTDTDADRSYVEYTGGHNEQEQLRQALHESQRPYRYPASSSSDGSGDSPPMYPDLADLRNRRAEFYQ